MAGQGFQVGKGFTIPAAATNPVAQPTLSTAATGGTMGGTFYVKYTWVTANGETVPCTGEPSITVSGPNGTLTVSLPGVPSSPIAITGANIYVGTVSGGESFQGFTSGTSLTLTSYTPGRPMPTYNTTSYQDINPSTMGLGAGTEFIVHDVYYEAPIAMGMWDGTVLTVFDGDNGSGARENVSHHCNGSQWLRLFNTSSANTLRCSVDGMQTQ